MPGFADIITLMNEKKAVELLQDMIRFNTANPPGSELALAEYLAQVLKRCGIKSQIDYLEEDRGNVIGLIRGSGNRPGLLFNGHLDVVPAGQQPWQNEPFGGTVKDGKIYGRGAADMKGGLAAMVMAAGLVARAGVRLQGDLLIAGTAGEEVDSIGAVDLLNKGYLKNIGAALIAEPSNLKIFTATKGVLWLEFTTAGRTAHGSMPECGNNAILQMNALLNKLSRYRFKFSAHDSLGGPTINIATIKGGIKTNVVPDGCTLTVDMRTVPGQNHQEILKDMYAIMEELCREVEGFQGTLKIINNRPPIETPVDNPFVRQVARTAGEVMGTETLPCGVNYYTDASIFAPALGIPIVVLGPGDEKMAHQPDEYVEVEKYLAAVRVFVKIILDWLT